jgi:hypothetical protein
VALVFTVSGPSTARNPAGPSFATAPAAPVVQPERIPYQTVFVLDADRSDDALPGLQAGNDSFAWMNQLHFAPIERTELDDWQMRTAEPIEVRSLGPRWVSPVGLDDSPPQEAMTAFQFQR